MMNLLFYSIISIIVVILILIMYKSLPPVKLYVDEKNLLHVKASIINKKNYMEYLSNYEKKIFKNNDMTVTELLYTNKKKNNAFIWIHGYNDYYFHFHVGEKLLENDYDVYAITLRNYGKVAIDRRYIHYVKNWDSYFEDINNSLEWITKNKKHKKFVLYGHSTGGLISTIYMNNGKYNNIFDGLILNSPFFDFYDTDINEFIIKYIFYYITLISPTFVAKSGYNKVSNNGYGKNILQRYYYNQNYKLTYPSHIFGTFLQNATYYQNKIQNNEINISKPILVLYSEQSTYQCNDNTDCVLDVSEIEKYSKIIGNNVKLHSINGAIHDILLSKDDISNKGIEYIIKFINNL